MKTYYVNRGHALGRYACVTMEGNEEDTCLSGELGEIWYRGNGLYSAVVALKSKNEKIISFDSKDLGKWVLKLKVPSTVAKQVFWANNPDARHR